MDPPNGRPPEPDYRCKRCGLVGTPQADGHLEPEQCIDALRSALRHHHAQLQLALRAQQPVRPPVKTG